MLGHLSAGGRQARMIRDTMVARRPTLYLHCPERTDLRVHGTLKPAQWDHGVGCEIRDDQSNPCGGRVSARLGAAMCRISAALCFAVLPFLMACDSGDTTGPADLPAKAEIEIVRGSGAWTGCSTYWCDFVAEARNAGPDCADQVRGVVRLFGSNDAQIGGTKSWSYRDAGPSGGGVHA